MDQGAPSSWMAAGPGLTAVASDGAAVGTLLHVLGLPEEDVFDGIVIDVDGGGHGFVDADDVAGFYEHAVVLRLDASECTQLPAPQPAPGGLTATGDSPPPGPLQRKLHRAWELISGKG